MKCLANSMSGLAVKSLPDWVSALIALAGLVGGPTAGVYIGGVKRARLEDRRRLLQLDLPWLHRRIFRAQAPGTVVRRSISPPPVGVPDADSGAAAAFAARDAIREATEVVELLPWTERVLWRRDVRLTLVTAGIHHVVDLHEPAELVDYDYPVRESSGAIVRCKAETLAALNMAALLRSGPLGAPGWLRDASRVEEERLQSLRAERDAAWAELRRYLVLQVNPGLAAGLRTRLVAWRLFWAGQHPWDREIRLTSYAAALTSDIEGPSRSGRTRDDVDLSTMTLCGQTRPSPTETGVASTSLAGGRCGSL